MILAITAALQLSVVAASGSIALLADAIHNVGDAVTAIPLWIAFQLVRRKPSPRFTYGLGRVEDLAGISIVAIILFSALVALYESVDRLIHPQTIGLLGVVAVAGVIGFIGNEAVAIFRIRVGRQISSAALIADGYHARTDGLTSLAVVLGAFGVWMGFPLADPIIGLIITLAIFGIVWQSTKAVFTRLLDGVEPGVIEEIRHAAGHVSAVKKVLSVRARWLGHRLTTELDVAVASGTTIQEADAISAEAEATVADHVPALASAHVRVRSDDDTAAAAAPVHAGHHHAPDPVEVKGTLARGVLEIVDTPDGERMQFVASWLAGKVELSVVIDRPDVKEVLFLHPQAENSKRFLSPNAPNEPHEFKAHFIARCDGHEETFPFGMMEPVGRVH